MRDMRPTGNRVFYCSGVSQTGHGSIANAQRRSSIAGADCPHLLRQTAVRCEGQLPKAPGIRQESTRVYELFAIGESLSSVPIGRVWPQTDSPSFDITVTATAPERQFELQVGLGDVAQGVANGSLVQVEPPVSIVVGNV